MMREFVKVFSTYGRADDLADRINRVLYENADAHVKSVFPCPMEKIGGEEQHVMVIFEYEA